MKRQLKTAIIFLSAFAMIFSFTACGNDDEEKASAPKLQMRISQTDWDSYRQTVKLPTGLTMAYVEMGPADGVPLVLIHGMTDNSRSWSLIAPYFAEAGYRVYMPDLRGHGESEQPDSGLYTTVDYAADISAFMDAKGVEKANIVGHSLGSMVAQTFQFLYPQKCDHVVWESTSSVNSDALGTDIYEYALSLGATGHPDDAFMSEWYACNNPVDEEFLGFEMEESQALPGADWARIAGGLSFSDMDPYYQYMDNTIPTLILWGTADSFFNEASQSTLRGKVSYAEFKSYSGIGHNIQWEAPQMMAMDCITFFMNQWAPAEKAATENAPE